MSLDCVVLVMLISPDIQMQRHTPHTVQDIFQGNLVDVGIIFGMLQIGALQRDPKRAQCDVITFGVWNGGYKPQS